MKLFEFARISIQAPEESFRKFKVYFCYNMLLDLITGSGKVGGVGCMKVRSLKAWEVKV